MHTGQCDLVNSGKPCPKQHCLRETVDKMNAAAGLANNPKAKKEGNEEPERARSKSQIRRDKWKERRKQKKEAAE